MAISFDVSAHDNELIREVAERAVTLAATVGGFFYDRLDAEMDITAAHANGNPLDLERLLAFPDADFGHDVFGIRKYLDRNTGELTRCFVPRCSQPDRIGWQVRTTERLAAYEVLGQSAEPLFAPTGTLATVHEAGRVPGEYVLKLEVEGHTAYAPAVIIDQFEREIVNQ